MTWEWKIGDPVDDATGGSMDAQNWGRRVGGDEVDNIGRNLPDSRIEEYGKKAWNLYMDFKEEEALRYINMALDLDKNHANNWNRKAIILEGMKRFEESEECYNRSLELSRDNLVFDNKARMLYDWAAHLIEESKNLPNGLEMLNDANDIVLKAMYTLPGKNSEENIEKYLNLRDSIRFYIKYEMEFQKNLETVKKYGKSELFTITGRDHYKNKVDLTPGKPLRLVREKNNKFDRDAIAVYAEGKKIGYVANSDYTKFEGSSSASKLKDKIPDVAQGEYLVYLNRYAEIQFSIGRII